jgi:hypothetical protein
MGEERLVDRNKKLLSSVHSNHSMNESFIIIEPFPISVD